MNFKWNFSEVGGLVTSNCEGSNSSDKEDGDCVTWIARLVFSWYEHGNGDDCWGRRSFSSCCVVADFYLFYLLSRVWGYDCIVHTSPRHIPH